MAARPLVKSRVTKAILGYGSAKWRCLGLDFSDLMQEGYVGLLAALDTFDAEHPSGCGFVTHATWRIDSHIRHALRDTAPGGMRPFSSTIQDRPVIFPLETVFNHKEVMVKAP